MKLTFKDQTSIEIINNSFNEYDSNNNLIHSKKSDGYEVWYEYDSKNNVIHSKNSDGYEYWNEYDSNNNLIHRKYSTGYEYWYDYKGNKISKEEFEKNKSNCNGKEVMIDGKKYQLTLIK